MPNSSHNTRANLKKLFVCSTLLFLISICTGGQVWAGPEFIPSAASDSIVGWTPKLSIPQVGRIEFKPFGKFGYRRVGWSAKVPISAHYLPSDSLESIDEYYNISPKEIDLWLGEAGVEAKFVNGSIVILRASGNILQNVLNTWVPETRVEAERLLWRQSSFSWIEVEGLLIQPIMGNICIQAGLKYDDFRLAFKKPYELTSMSSSRKTAINFRAHQADSYIWFPYMGLGWNGSQLKFFVSASMFAPSTIRMESRINAISSKTSDVSCYTVFSSKEPATYMEMNVEYFINVLKLVNLSLWGKAGWMKASGKGEVTNKCDVFSGSANLPFDVFDITFTRYDVGAGLSLNIAF